MTTPAEYMRDAEDCLHAMRGAVLPEVRVALLNMAKRCTELAEQAERNAAIFVPNIP
jgi:hypothetical protein